MSDPLEFLPGYVSPLTDKEHATIGRIALLWGQVEHFVEVLLPIVTGLTLDELDALQISSKTIASKVDFLAKASSRVERADIRDGIKRFCAIIYETKSQRNHIFHGMWGWRGDDRTQRAFPAACKRSDLSSPFPADKLSTLEKKLCKCARMGFDLFTRYHGQLERPHPSRFFHHNAAGEAPEWLLQWSTRNRWDDEDPGRIESAGQLPRRSSLFPQQ